ncbi:phosphonate C-P lyase system protein PhnH [Labrys sp. ZIDIC5]|uniref:phosphonate C-P lyase system protein PhnH n=1 Tax=Labrys sedimenti TaxID=3106036 RepID=UPI002ACA7C42|nr:phosphonate C-P lyase system protein PhnH [Labrys sp. ZIDIC5]MDZ5449807.1 phosphonate C-P lyase system protein PhnH [Labrys sp. ZIDIC5]
MISLAQDQFAQDLAPGFADAALESQAVFRACMNALARPARPQPLLTGLVPPAPLTPELAALALAVADHEAPLWLDARLRTAEVRAYLTFHTGAHLTEDPQEAAFALVADAAACPDLASFAQGSDEYPDRSTTLLIALERLEAGHDLAFTGPGIKADAGLALAPLPDDFRRQLSANHAAFPCGVDIVFTAPGRIAGLPRSSQILGVA